MMVSYVILSSRAFSLQVGYFTYSATWAVATSFCSKGTGHGSPMAVQGKVKSDLKNFSSKLASLCLYFQTHKNLNQSSVYLRFFMFCVNSTKTFSIISPGSIGKGSQKFVHIQVWTGIADISICFFIITFLFLRTLCMYVFSECFYLVSYSYLMDTRSSVTSLRFVCLFV